MLQKLNASVSTEGIAHTIIQVGDLAGAAEFYRDVLGMTPVGSDSWPDCGANMVFGLPSGQHVILAESEHRDDPSVSAAHYGYAVSPEARKRIVDAVATSGHPVHDYHEDRPVETKNNVYFDDPAGNRIQLVCTDTAGGTGVSAIDHAAIEVSDILWSELFFEDWLGWPSVHRVGWNTQDYLAAKAKGEAGMKEAMPGTRYWNERYSPFETERKALRPCPQISFDAGAGCSLVVYLAARHYQIPPDDLIVGTPRIGFRVAANAFDDLAQMLDSHRVRHVGPVGRDNGVSKGMSLYVRDPGGNFLEFAAAD